jgi:hypothetical protein
MDAARTEHPLAAIKRFAADAFQDDCRRIHPPQLSGLFVHEALDAGTDAEDLAAEWHELGVEREASVRKLDVQRRKNFFIGFDPHQVAGPKSEIASGRRLADWDRSPQSGERNAAGDGLNSIV